MTLPTNQPINGTDDDSDMFGPPRSSPPIGYHHHRSKVPMISPKLRQREERKRIIQLCAHKLERIKDSEANLRRSVCINNTYSRLNDEVRREKQNRYLANLPKPDLKPETAHDNIFSSYTSCNGGNQNDDIINNTIPTTNNNNNINNNNNHHHYLQNDSMEIYPNLSQHYHHFNHLQQQQPSISHSNNNNSTTITTSSLSLNQLSTGKPTTIPIQATTSSINNNNNNNNQNSTNNSNLLNHQHHHQNNSNLLLSSSSTSCHNNLNSTIYSSSSINTTISSLSTSSSSLLSSTQITHTTNNNDKKEKRFRSTFNLSNNSVDTDLEILDRELSAIDASMPLIDPEITQGAEHLEIAISSRKRLRNNNNNNNEDENDRLVREALSQFYLPTQRLISAIDDCPLDIKRTKLNNNHHHHHLHNINNINNNIGICGNNNDLDLDLALDLNPTNHKEFEVIMDALRLGTPSPTSSCGSDSCGQAAMMSESGGGVFHNLVVTSLET